MKTALEVFTQNNGDVTKTYYQELEKFGSLGHIACCLFRAQKRSSRAKDYHGGRYRRAAYDVKSWSMQELCKALAQQTSIAWGWKPDPSVPFGNEPSHVLYVDLPTGQVSFHSPERMVGPDYPGEWDGSGKSADRIIQFCDHVVLGNLVFAQDVIGPTLNIIDDAMEKMA